MPLKISLGRILGTVTGMALSGPGGAVLGGLTGGLVDAVLPGVSETVGETLGEVGAEMLTASAESVQARLAAGEIQPLDSDLYWVLVGGRCRLVSTVHSREV